LRESASIRLSPQPSRLSNRIVLRASQLTEAEQANLALASSSAASTASTAASAATSAATSAISATSATAGATANGGAGSVAVLKQGKLVKKGTSDAFPGRTRVLIVRM
jgi:hypothetical protein